MRPCRGLDGNQILECDSRSDGICSVMYGWSMGFDGWIWMAVWIGVLAVLVWALVREPRRSERDEAMDILRARFANGDINAEEYERATHVLKP